MPAHAPHPMNVTAKLRTGRALATAPGEPSRPLGLTVLAPPTPAEPIAVSSAFRGAVALALRAAATNASVLISGESGTGKEVIAQLVHARSPRAQRKLVPLNCAALPDALLESELFGHVKGAFSGADRDKPGLLEIADGGTLFLDEFTEMSPRLQAKLLRVLQDGVVRRVGSERTDALVDVRVLSATNRDPHLAVSEGRLRADLLYRLCVVHIRIPALRERAEDVAPLARHYLARFWARHRGDLVAPVLSNAVLEHLAALPWPGNVRELQNAMERLAVEVDPGVVVGPEHLDAPAEEPLVAAIDRVPDMLLSQPYYEAREALMGAFEHAYLKRLIGRSGGNMSKASRLGRIDRTTLYRLLARHRLRRADEGTFIEGDGDGSTRPDLAELATEGDDAA